MHSFKIDIHESFTQLPPFDTLTCYPLTFFFMAYTFLTTKPKLNHPNSFTCFLLIYIAINDDPKLQAFRSLPPQASSLTRILQAIPRDALRR